MSISDNLLRFIRDPENQALIERNKFEELYEQALHCWHYSMLTFPIGELTELLYTSDVDPLPYMKEIPDRFLWDGNITKIEIPNNIEAIGYSAFRECEHLTGVAIPDGVKSIGESAFRDCTNLTSVVIGNGVIEIGEFAFYGCPKLISVTIPNSCTTIEGEAFAGCENLKDVYYNSTQEQWNRIKGFSNIIADIKIWGDDMHITIHCTDGDLII